MIRGFYSGASCLVTQQNNMNTIANNIANISTTAFKPQQSAFSALLYENVYGGAGTNVRIGHGVKIQKTGVDFTQGDLKKTDMPMDCSLLGEGFFAIENKTDSSITYTRDGSFEASVAEGNSYLVNGAGNYVLDSSGARIEIKDGFDSKKVGVYSFSNPYGLQLIGGNQFKVTEASGEATAVETPNLKVGYLENSGVQISEEMVKMIESSKGFSFASRVVQTADEMEKVINQLR